MACMATLLLGLGVTVGGWVVERGGSYTSSFTVNVPANTEGMSDKLGDVLAALKKTHGVTDIAQTSEEKLRDMLRPWLGNSEAVDALPLPIVLDITTDGTPIDYKVLQSILSHIADGTEVDAHELWVASFIHFSYAVRTLLAMLATLIVGGLGLMIAFTSRASLKLHARTVNLLHSIGAEDDYIMRQFQHESPFLVTLRGTVPGCLSSPERLLLRRRPLHGLAGVILRHAALCDAGCASGAAAFDAARLRFRRLDGGGVFPSCNNCNACC